MGEEKDRTEMAERGKEKEEKEKASVRSVPCGFDNN